MAKYYIIETVYAGPDVEDHADDRTVAISKRPAKTHESHEVRLTGWCGTTHNFATYAHGAFNTITDAREAINRLFDVVRDTDLEEYLDCVEAYGPSCMVF